MSQAARLLAKTTSVLGLAADSSHVYWGTYDTGELLRVSRAGGTEERLAGGQAFVNSLAVDGQHVYWTIGHGTTPGGSVLRVVKSGGTAEMIAARQAGATSVVVDEEHVFWVVGGGFDGTGQHAVAPAIVRRPKGQETAASIVSADVKAPARIVLDGRFVYGIDQGASHQDGRLFRVPKSGGALTVLASSLSALQDLAVDQDFVYVTQRGTAHVAPVSCSQPPCPQPTAVPEFRQGSVLRVPKSGGPLRTVAVLPGAADGIGLAGDQVYVASGHLNRVPKLGGEPVELVVGLGAPGRFVALGQSLFGVWGAAVTRLDLP